MLDNMVDDMLTKDLNSAQGVDAGGLEVYAVWCYEPKRPSDAPDDPGYQMRMKEYAATAKLIKASIVLTSPTDRGFEHHEYQNFPGSRSGMQAALSWVLHKVAVIKRRGVCKKCLEEGNDFSLCAGKSEHCSWCLIDLVM